MKKPDDICCPSCGKVCGQEHDRYIELGRDRVKYVKPFCPRAVEAYCRRCREHFVVEKAGVKGY